MRALKPISRGAVSFNLRTAGDIQTTALKLAASFWTIAIAFTLLRIGALVWSQTDLGPDESQYWFWSRDPAFGYFSKPPFIAWAIAATTTIFGNEEWAVRLSAPLFHLGAAAFLYFTAKKLFDQRIAYWAGLAWLTIPGVTLSSYLMTTDAPLLFFWSAALYFTYRIVLDEKPPLSHFIFLGAAIGLGFLSKYAMIYFVIALGGAAMLMPAFHSAFLRRETLTTIALAALLVAPNIAWNAAHDFQTVAHTAANANWGATLFKPLNLASFFGEQFAVAGPILFAVFLWAVASQLKDAKLSSWRANNAHALYLFALTPLAIVCAQAFISRAHANWAAASYPAVMILAVAWLFQKRASWLAKASIVFHAALALIFIGAMSNLSTLERASLSTALQEVRGWEHQSRDIAAMAKGFDAVMLDDRALMGAMLYYERASDLTIVAIDPNASVSHHYEAFNAFDPTIHKRVLFVTTREDAAHVDYRFRQITPLGAKTVELGGGVTRTYHLFDVSGYYGPKAQ